MRRLLALAILATAPAGVWADEPLRYEDGAATFKANCAVCHRPNGAGTAGLAPPVTVYPPRFVATAEGRRQLVLTSLYGMYGEISVEDRRYNFKMPEFSRLDDATLAATLNHVVFDLGRAPAEAKPIEAAEIAAERTIAVDGAEVRTHRESVIGGLPQ